MKFLSFVRLVFLISLFPIASQAANGQSSEAEVIFERFAGAAVKIRVVDVASGAKSVIGTGFFVSSDGYLLTNYHVISNWIHDPDKYRVEYLDEDKNPHDIQVLNIDVVNDLAVARAAHPANRYLFFSEGELSQGARIFSFGFPHDYGITIVEGTYNGLLEHAFYKKIHFTGSLNPGMSGGPAVNAQGEVIGINVATSGNQVSFLVPVDYARRLYSATVEEVFKPPASFVALVEQQLKTHQQAYVAESLFVEPQQVELGGYQAPTAPADFFNCWGGSSDDEDAPSTHTTHQCSTDDYLYISNRHVAGSAYMRHRLIESKSLNDYQFANLFTQNFSLNTGRLWEDAEQVTPYRCQSDALSHNELKYKTAFCVRRYRKMDGLYDAVFKLATLGDTQRGVISELILFGVTFETAVDVSKRYLESFAWSR